MFSDYVKADDQTRLSLRANAVIKEIELYITQMAVH